MVKLLSLGKASFQEHFGWMICWSPEPCCLSLSSHCTHLARFNLSPSAEASGSSFALESVFNLCFLTPWEDIEFSVTWECPVTFPLLSSPSPFSSPHLSPFSEPSPKSLASWPSLLWFKPFPWARTSPTALAHLTSLPRCCSQRAIFHLHTSQPPLSPAARHPCTLGVSLCFSPSLIQNSPSPSQLPLQNFPSFAQAHQAPSHLWLCRCSFFFTHTVSFSIPLTFPWIVSTLFRFHLKSNILGKPCLTFQLGSGFVVNCLLGFCNMLTSFCTVTSVWDDTYTSWGVSLEVMTVLHMRHMHCLVVLVMSLDSTGQGLPHMQHLLPEQMTSPKIHSTPHAAVPEDTQQGVVPNTGSISENSFLKPHQTCFSKCPRHHLHPSNCALAFLKNHRMVTGF